MAQTPYRIWDPVARSPKARTTSPTEPIRARLIAYLTEPARRLAAAAMLLFATVLPAASELPVELENVGIEERIGESVDLDMTFLDESSRPVRLGDFFATGRPLIVNLVYYACPMLCNLTLRGQTNSLREIPWTPGDEFEVVTISIDPREMPALAREKKQAYLAAYGRPAPGWHFLSDYDGNVARLANQLGFRYKFNEARQEWAHTAAIFILTPAGKISRYLYGIDYDPRDVRLALTEAAESKFAFSPVDRLLLFCFYYDPDARSYVPFAMNFMRASGALTVFVLGVVMVRLWRREKASATGLAGVG